MVIRYCIPPGDDDYEYSATEIHIEIFNPYNQETKLG